MVKPASGAAGSFDEGAADLSTRAEHRQGHAASAGNPKRSWR
jgi:hypothetical protein